MRWSSFSIKGTSFGLTTSLLKEWTMRSGEYAFTAIATLLGTVKIANPAPVLKAASPASAGAPE